MAEDKARVAVALRDPLPWRDLREVAETAEDTGYEAIFVPEIAGREAFGTLAGLAGVTSRALLGTGVVSVRTRSAQVAAMGAATVQEVSGGRFVLGIGAGEERRLERVAAYVREVRALLDGGLWIRPEPPVPLWLAALGSGMVELAGEVADGVLLNWCTPERAARARKEVARGAERAGRDPSEVTVATYVRACLGQEEPEALAALAGAAEIYAAMPHYAGQLEAMGLGGRPPEEIARATGVWGDRKAGLERLGAWQEAGTDLVVVYPVPAHEPFSSILGTVMAAAPSPAL